MLPLPQTTGEIGIDLLDLNNEICLKKSMERTAKSEMQTNFAREKQQEASMEAEENKNTRDTVKAQTNTAE